MTNYIPFELYHQIKSNEPTHIEYFTPNKRPREMDLEMNINPIFEKENENPETNHPVVNHNDPPVFTFNVPEKTLFIHNKEFNPFIKKNQPKPHIASHNKFNIGYSGKHEIPMLDENGIKKKDLRFSKIQDSRINGVSVSVNNYTQLRNKILGMFYRKVLRPESDVSYCKDGLSIHGVGSKQNVLAIISLAKILHFRLNLKLRLRDGQIVCLVV